MLDLTFDAKEGATDVLVRDENGNRSQAARLESRL